MHPRVAEVISQMTQAESDELASDLAELAGRHNVVLDDATIEAALLHAIDHDWSAAGIDAALSGAPAPEHIPHEQLAQPIPDEEPYAPEQFEEDSLSNEPAPPPDWSEMNRRDQAAAMADRMRGDEAVVEYNVGDDGRPATDADWLTYQVARAQGYEGEA